MRLGTTTVGKVDWQVDGAVEVEGAVFVDVDVQSLEIGGRVNDADVTGLDEVIGDDDVLLIGSDLDVMGADGGLDSVGVVETLDVVQIGDVERSDVVGGRQGEVGEAAVLCDVRVDGDGVAGFLAEIVEELGDTLRAVGVEAERIDDPDLSEVNSGGDGSSLLVSRDELDVLDTATVGDGDGGEDLAGAELPETEGVGTLLAEGGLEDGDGNDEVRGEDQIFLEADGETVGGELGGGSIGEAGDGFGPFVDDVEVGISLDEATDISSYCGAHVGDEETSVSGLVCITGFIG